MADTGGEVNAHKKIECKERVKILREREAEERQRRLEELKRHALEAQQLREQKEVERRKRMEEMREKENERRSQVEERKKLIWEAERDRRESILRKNQEREARIEVRRKNERSNIVFAFGSSTPRLLEPVEGGYWLPRRATSTANLRLFPATNTTAPVTTGTVVPGIARRPSEREIDTKRRAASAGGLGDQMSSSMYAVFHWGEQQQRQQQPRLSIPVHTHPALSNIDTPLITKTKSHEGAGDSQDMISRAARRKTDLMPTVPSPRDKTASGSSRPGSGTRSLARTPGEVTPSRPGSALSQSSFNCASSLRMRPTPRKTRPYSIHVTGVSKDKNGTAPSPPDDKPKPKEQPSKPTANVKPSTPKHPPVKKQINQQKNEEIRKLKSKTKSVDKIERVVANNNSNNKDKQETERQQDQSQTTGPEETAVRDENVVLQKQAGAVKNEQVQKQTGAVKNEQVQKQTGAVKNEEVQKQTGAVKNEEVQKQTEAVKNEEVQKQTEAVKNGEVQKQTDGDKTLLVVNGDSVQGTHHDLVNNAVDCSGSRVENLVDLVNFVDCQPPVVDLLVSVGVDDVANVLLEPVISEINNSSSTEVLDNDGSTGGNLMSRSKITTEEEAKAALAERRRLAREQAEREAEAERRRLELEAEMEAERVRKEEEEQRRAEEEQLRLLEEARKLEQERLMLAIEETQKREAEERERRQLEETARIEKEESERKAREEAERQRVEMAERLKREEEERQARRRRVEAIMKRTRNNAPNSTAKGEKIEGSNVEQEQDESKGSLEVFLHGERVSTERSLINGQQNHQIFDNIIDKSPTNGVHTIVNNTLANEEDCINSNSTMVTPLIAFQGKKKETPVTNNYLA